MVDKGIRCRLGADVCSLFWDEFGVFFEVDFFIYCVGSCSGREVIGRFVGVVKW